jgi:hypothetical protein
MGLRLLWFGMKSLIDYCGDLFVRYTPRTPRTKFIVKPSNAMTVIPIPPFAYIVNTLTRRFREIVELF